MTSAPATTRYVHFFIVVLSLSVGCSRSPDVLPVTAVDLIRQFDRAEKRPPAGFEISTFEVGRITHASIAVPVPSRAIWALPLPRRGVLRASVAASNAGGDGRAGPVRIRVGVSDDRIYESLADSVVTPEDGRWLEIDADLSAYAGWKWSLFYRPDRKTWRVVLSADPMGGVPAIALWGSPRIVTDTKSAVEYTARRRTLQGS